MSIIASRRGSLVAIALCLALWMMFALRIRQPSEMRRLAFSKVKTSHLHFLVPASQPNLDFCYSLASAAANRYPAPMLLGWHATGELDAAETHLAKLRVIKRYFESLKSGPEDDDDLVLILDGYDVVHQLPPEIMIERYFDMTAKANDHLAQRMGLSVEDMVAKGMKQTILLGPDKICYPMYWKAPRCWGPPPSHLGANAFGPDTGPGDVTGNDPRWLNSGTIIGPVKDVKKMIDVVVEEIKFTYDEEAKREGGIPDSDQLYMADVWARQEYWRNRTFLADMENYNESDLIIPEKRTDDQETEFHIAIEYEASMFQTNYGYEIFVRHLQYKQDDQSAHAAVNFPGNDGGSQPYAIRMPDNVRKALMRLYNSVPDAHPGGSAEKWIRLVHLGTNLVTKHIYGLWHCAGDKGPFRASYPRLWFYPFAKSLVRESARAWRRHEPIAQRLIDGRKWVTKWPYVEGGMTADEYGGAWSDEGGDKFIPWKQMCGEHETELFWGQYATGFD